MFLVSPYLCFLSTVLLIPLQTTLFNVLADLHIGFPLNSPLQFPVPFPTVYARQVFCSALRETVRIRHATVALLNYHSSTPTYSSSDLHSKLTKLFPLSSSLLTRLRSCPQIINKHMVLTSYHCQHITKTVGTSFKHYQPFTNAPILN